MKLADSISDPASPVPTFASFAVEDGKPGAEPTWGSADGHRAAEPKRLVVSKCRALHKRPWCDSQTEHVSLKQPFAHQPLRPNLQPPESHTCFPLRLLVLPVTVVSRW